MNEFLLKTKTIVLVCYTLVKVKPLLHAVDQIQVMLLFSKFSYFYNAYIRFCFDKDLLIS